MAQEGGRRSRRTQSHSTAKTTFTRSFAPPHLFISSLIRRGENSLISPSVRAAAAVRPSVRPSVFVRSPLLSSPPPSSSSSASPPSPSSLPPPSSTPPLSLGSLPSVPLSRTDPFPTNSDEAVRISPFYSVARAKRHCNGDGEGEKGGERCIGGGGGGGGIDHGTSVATPPSQFDAVVIGQSVSQSVSQ